MAKYDFGGGCPCGLYKNCICGEYEMTDNELNDFGFTTEPDEKATLVAREAGKAAEVDRLRNRLNQMYESIMPLLENLKKNPENEMIRWPNRDQHIDEFIKKLDRIRDS